MKSLVLSCRESYSINDCRSLLCRVPNSHIVYTFLEANQSVDALARLGRPPKEDFELFFNPPDPVRRCVFFLWEIREFHSTENVLQRRAEAWALQTKILNEKMLKKTWKRPFPNLWYTRKPSHLCKLMGNSVAFPFQMFKRTPGKHSSQFSDVPDYVPKLTTKELGYRQVVSRIDPWVTTLLFTSNKLLWL